MLGLDKYLWKSKYITIKERSIQAVEELSKVQEGTVSRIGNTQKAHILKKGCSQQ